MSGMAIVVYSISKHNPRILCEDKERLAEFQDHLDLLGKLTPDMKSRYDDVLLSMARYLKSYAEANHDKRSAMQKEISDAFMGVSYDEVVDEDPLYLVEWIKIDGEVYENPVNVWTVDPRLFKAVLVRNLSHMRLNADCREVIIEHYGLESYHRSVKIGGVDDTEKINYINKFNYYLAEFYKRSDSYDQAKLVEYIEKSGSHNALLTYFGHDSSDEIKFEYNLNINNTLEQTESYVDEFCNNIKYFAKRMYELNYPEDYLKSTTGRGKSHYTVKFRTYDKCLSVYDNYKGIVPSDRSIDDESFGLKIDRQEKTTKLPERERLDRRKDIRKHYKMALELIQQSLKGYLA